jgi:uncharacterized protein YpmB
MSKTKQKSKLQKRDWVIIVLFLAIIGTNWVWYQSSKSQDITNRNESSAWLMHQVEINRLKSCIDEGTRPCDITPPQQ